LVHERFPLLIGSALPAERTALVRRVVVATDGPTLVEIITSAREV